MNVKLRVETEERKRQIDKKRIYIIKMWKVENSIKVSTRENKKNIHIKR